MVVSEEDSVAKVVRRWALDQMVGSPCLHSWAKCLNSIASLHSGVYIGTCSGMCVRQIDA